MSRLTRTTNLIDARYDGRAYPGRGEEPAVAHIHGTYKTRHLLVELPNLNGRAMALGFGEARRLEDGHVISRKAVLPDHLRTNLLTDRAASSVSPNEELSSDDLLRPCVHGANPSMDLTCVLCNLNDFLAKHDMNRWQGACMLKKDGLKLILAAK